MDIDRELKRIMLALGTTTDADVIKKEVLKNVVWKAADLISVGVRALPVRNIGVIDIANFFPSEFATGNWPRKYGSVANRQTVTWTEWNTTLYKTEYVYTLDDTVKLRGLENYQAQAQAKRAAEAVAFDKDYCIIDAIYAQPFVTNTVAIAAGNEWDGGGAGADPEGDIVKAWGNIYANSNTTENDMRSAKLIVPATCAASLMRLVLIGNVQQTISDYLGKTFGLEILPTRYWSDAGITGIQDDAILLINSEDTGTHFVLETGVIPMVEQIRNSKEGGDDYIIRQYFNTKIMPDSATDATNRRIALITNVT